MLDRLVRALPAIAWMAFIFAMSSREQFPQTFGMSASMLAVAAHMVLYGTLAMLLLLIVVMAILRWVLVVKLAENHRIPTK